MSVREKDRTESRFKVFLTARELTIHTDLILANKKVFECKTQLDVRFLMSISQSALDIYTKSWKANNIQVHDSDDYYRRRNLQLEALEECTALMAYIDLARKKFHLRSNKYLYWKDLAIKEHKLLINWFQSNEAIYKNYRK